MLHQGTRWVMRVSRLKTRDLDAGNAQFVDAFEARQLTASPSRLSRWEYGQSPGSHRLLRAYEDGTGLPPYLLFAINDRQRRAAEDCFASEPTIDVAEGITADDVYVILDKAVSGQDVTGSDWYALAAFSVSSGFFYLSPGNTQLLAYRLLEELARSIGAGYLLRFEALHLFASMARVDSAMVAELVAMISTERTGMLGDAVSLILRPSPAVGRALAQQVRSAESPAVQQASSWLEDILRDRAPQPEPPVSRRQVVDLRDLLSEDLPGWATAHLENEVTTPLIDTALGGRSRLQRHEASLLLMAAGLASAVEAPLLDAFERESDPVWRTRLAHLNEYLIPPASLDRLEKLALCEDDPEVRRALWNARAHAPVPIHPTPDVLRQLADPPAEAALTSALGLTGSVDDELLSNPAVEDPHGLLAWWRDHGPALTY